MVIRAGTVAIYVVASSTTNWLYRLDQPTEARKQSQRATERLKQMSDAGLGTRAPS